ncbi:hypothetical protein [Candidatus Electronema sp. JM]|uniref:hypothetical protein n=1 Tax=Candidatus Electronema sp. JM TaxID=3401571 RepID=UPI003AA9B72A
MNMGLCFFGIISASTVVLAVMAVYPTMPKARVWKDKKTGCEYLVSAGSIIPRLDGSRQQIGCRWIDPDTGVVATDVGIQTAEVTSRTIEACSRSGKRLVPEPTPSAKNVR